MHAGPALACRTTAARVSRRLQVIRNQLHPSIFDEMSHLRPPSSMAVCVIPRQLSHTVVAYCVILLYQQPLLLRGGIVNRTYGTHKNLQGYMFNHFYEQYLVLLTMAPRNSCLMTTITVFFAKRDWFDLWFSRR